MCYGEQLVRLYHMQIFSGKLRMEASAPTYGPTGAKLALITLFIMLLVWLNRREGTSSKGESSRDSFGQTPHFHKMRRTNSNLLWWKSLASPVVPNRKITGEVVAPVRTGKGAKCLTSRLI